MRYPGHCDQMRLLMNDLQAQSRPRHVEAHSRKRRAADAAGRRGHLRRGHRQAGRRASRGELRQQGVPANDRGSLVVGHSSDDGVRDLRRRRSGGHTAAPGHYKSFVRQEDFRSTGRAHEPLWQALRRGRRQRSVRSHRRERTVPDINAQASDMREIFSSLSIGTKRNSGAWSSDGGWSNDTTGPVDRFGQPDDGRAAGPRAQRDRRRLRAHPRYHRVACSINGSSCRRRGVAKPFVWSRKSCASTRAHSAAW